MIDSKKKAGKTPAIVYTSNTGSTARYAKLLYYETDLPVYSLQEAKRRLPACSEIIYLGWLMAGKVKGYKKAAKRYRVQAVCAVGMGKTGTQIEDIQKKNTVPEHIPVFTLQGNFEVGKLRGIYRVMMDIMVKSISKTLAEKAERTPEEEEMLEMIFHGSGRVKPKNLDAVVDWYNANYK